MKSGRTRWRGVRRTRDAENSSGRRTIGDAFSAVPRAGFLPASQRPFAGWDQALPIGHGQTNSQPTTVANMLALLDVRPGHRILDVGSGSGWSTGLLAWLTGPTGSVIGVERIPQLVSAGSRAVASLGMPWAEIRQARPDVLGWPEDGPYDRILVSAMGSSLAADLVAQLAVGGVLVCPVNGVMHRLVRTEDGLQTTTHGQYVFVPLIAPGEN